MRRINSLLKNNSIKLNNVLQFPEDKLVKVWDNSSLDSLRIHLDAEEGNDVNDGLTWQTAKKSLKAAAEIIPYDLKGVHVLILVHPGIYDIEQIDFFHVNGTIRIMWMGTHINNLNAPFHQWCRNGSTSPIRNNNQAVFNIQAGAWTGFNVGGNFEFSLVQADFSFSWNQVGYGYWDKLVIRSSDGRTSGCLLNVGPDNRFTSDSGFTADLNQTSGIVFDQLRAKDGFINAMKIIGSNSGKSQSAPTSAWNGVILLGIGCGIELRSFGTKFAVGFEPPNNKTWHIINVKTLMSIGPGYSAKPLFKVTSSHLNFDPGITGVSKLGFVLGDSAEGTYYFHDDLQTYLDQSSKPHSITETKNNTIKTFASPNLTDTGSHIIQIAKNQIPSDSDMKNGQLSFYLDESNNKLMVKIKYSAGTIKTGELTLA